MSMILNLRGTSGAGKTECSRQIMTRYGWGLPDRAEALYRDGRRRPIAYRFRHPCGGRPLAVLGHYEVTSGGCDTIGGADGGLDAVFDLARELAGSGHDVLFEGLLLSSEHRRSQRLARSHRLHVLLLDTPLERCIRNVILRRRAGTAGRAAIARTIAAEHDRIVTACDRLRPHVPVEVLDFESALARAGDLLGCRPLLRGETRF